ncbi:hypothetical protein TDB9533_04681 [Thalassocella blandensis]|nr:hypothetical protein TDB9533_04681 [Thalassocella blandensis]
MRRSRVSSTFLVLFLSIWFIPQPDARIHSINYLEHVQAEVIFACTDGKDLHQELEYLFIKFVQGEEAIEDDSEENAKLLRAQIFTHVFNLPRYERHSANAPGNLTETFRYIRGPPDSIFLS